MQDYSDNLTAESWVKHVAEATRGGWGAGKGKKAIRENIMHVSFEISDARDLNRIVESSKDFACQYSRPGARKETN